MLAIRLTRRGRKNQPFFRVVVIDKRRSSKGGRAVEELGYVDPLTKRKSINKERVLYWIKNGAKPSDTMHNLLVSEKIIEGKKINVSKKPDQNTSNVADESGSKKTAEQTQVAQVKEGEPTPLTPEASVSAQEIKGEPSQAPKTSGEENPKPESN